MKNKLKKGQILIEILVAITIFAFLAVSIYSLMVMSRKTSRMSIQKMQAQNYVQEGIEKVRSIRDYNLKSGSVYDDGMDIGAYKVELSADPNRFQLTSATDELISGTVFTRVIDIYNDGNDTITVTIIVKWDNSEEKAVTYLTNWKAP